MKMHDQIEEAEVSILHTYNRFPVVFERGEGAYLYDTEGKKYLDFAAGIAVNALGYHYPGYDEALKAQIDKLMQSKSIYRCLTCFACLERCPRNVEPAKLIEAVRLAVIRQQGMNHMTENDIPALLDDKLPQQAIVSAMRKYKK